MPKRRSLQDLDEVVELAKPYMLEMQTTGFAQIILSSVDQRMLTLTEYYT